MEAGPAQLFGPTAFGPVRLRNRIIKAATFEGMSWRGSVSDALVDFHRTFAAGGVGIYRGTHCVLVAPPDRPGLRLGRPGREH
jgi:2,4-dienoyl-CoA reductase-like NADH-dependent reductase (Old Yellow Enzyme family)